MILTIQMCQLEGRSDALETAQISVNHRWLARSETEAGVVRRSPAFIEDAGAAGRVRTSGALWDEVIFELAGREVELTRGTYALIFLCYVDQTELEYALKEPISSISNNLNQFHGPR